LIRFIRQVKSLLHSDKEGYNKSIRPGPSQFFDRINRIYWIGVGRRLRVDEGVIGLVTKVIGYDPKPDGYLAATLNADI
jgi:hypothetical protein